MKPKTVIHLRWKITNRVEIFVNLGKVYSFYKYGELGISRWTLDKKNLFSGWENDIIEIKKYYLK